MMKDINRLATVLDALGHPLRLKIVYALLDGDQYLAQLAEKLGVSRALAKVHLMKMERAGLVESRVELVENQAKALRYYRLKEFDIEVNPKVIRGMVE